MWEIVLPWVISLNPDICYLAIRRTTQMFGGFLSHMVGKIIDEWAVSQFAFRISTSIIAMVLWKPAANIYQRNIWYELPSSK